MTQVMISHKYKKTCDGCGLVKEYEMVEPSEAQIVEMTEWFTVIREFFDGQHFIKAIVQACNLQCVPAAAVKLAMPVAPEPIDNIDLASLQQTKPSDVN
jgi:hypothetical protein